MLFWTFFQTSGGGKSSQEMIEELASDILTKIPADFNLEECQVSTSYLSTMSTMCTSVTSLSPDLIMALMKNPRIPQIQTKFKETASQFSNSVVNHETEIH